MSDSLDNGPDHRQRVATLLGLLASEEAQTLLARQTPRERLAYELARYWFDVVYTPSGRYVDGLKGDFSMEAAESFNDAFDPVELAAMERFHRFFELRIGMLAPGQLDAKRIPIDETWRTVMKDAGYLLEDLHVDPTELRRRLHDDPKPLSDLIRIEA